MAQFKADTPIPEWLKKMESVHEYPTCKGQTLAQGDLAWLRACSDNNSPKSWFLHSSPGR